MKKAQEKMNELSPEDRKKMEDAMGGMFDFDVQKTGTSRKIAGFHCENWKITLGQFSKTEECLTSELQFPAEIHQRQQAVRGFGLALADGIQNSGHLAHLAWVGIPHYGSISALAS